MQQSPRFVQQTPSLPLHNGPKQGQYFGFNPHNQYQNQQIKSPPAMSQYSSSQFTQKSVPVNQLNMYNANNQYNANSQYNNMMSENANQKNSQFKRQFYYTLSN